MAIILVPNRGPTCPSKGPLVFNRPSELSKAAQSSHGGYTQIRGLIGLAHGHIYIELK